MRHATAIQDLKRIIRGHERQVAFEKARCKGTGRNPERWHLLAKQHRMLCNLREDSRKDPRDLPKRIAALMERFADEINGSNFKKEAA